MHLEQIRPHATDNVPHEITTKTEGQGCRSEGLGACDGEGLGEAHESEPAYSPADSHGAQRHFALLVFKVASLDYM